MTPAQLRAVERIVLTGCGTALHAGMVGEYLIEQLAHIPTEVELRERVPSPQYADDARHAGLRHQPERRDGGHAGALRESRRKGHRTLGICNNVASTIARESDGGVYMHAGPEIGVAATKSFTSQVTILTLSACCWAASAISRRRRARESSRRWRSCPNKIEQILKLSDQIKAIAHKYVEGEGDDVLRPAVQLSRWRSKGALKMKEITYIHAEGHPSAELKHGVIALVRPEVPSVFIAPDDSVFSKNLNNIEQVRARKGPVIAVTTEGCAKHLERIADDIVIVPDAPDFLCPILTVIPLQLLAYHLAVELGRDVDKPRNLAKSVTVE